MSTATASTEEKIEALIEGTPNPPCPQSSCHGSLEKREDTSSLVAPTSDGTSSNDEETDDLICHSCHCRRDGVFFYPDDEDGVTDDEEDTRDDERGFYFETANYTPPYEVCSQEDEAETYDNSESVILNGGHEHAYWTRINGPEYAIDADSDEFIVPHKRDWDR